MYRWSVCPGSVRESRGVENTSSSYARLGSAAHEVGERCLKGEKQPAEFLGQQIDLEDGGELIPVDQEMVEAVQVYVDTVRHVWAQAKASLTMGTVLIEHRFNLSTIYEGLFGTCDAVVFDAEARRLHVIDYKHGEGVRVDVWQNPQLMYYALGALTSAPKDWRIEEVVLTVVQPRAYHNDGPVRSYAMPAFELMEFAVDLADYAAATQDPDAPLVPGDHCRFCPAEAKCPKLQEHATAAFLEAMTGGEPTADNEGEYFSEWLEKLDAIEGFCKAVREAAYARALAGKPVPKWKLVAKEGRRAWVSPEQTIAFLKAKGVAEDDMLEPPKERELKTPAQMEKLDPFKGKANAAAKMELQSLAAKKSSGTTLVPESDPRPAYSSADEFEAV